MLTFNLWTGVGLVNGAMGTVIAICYKSGQAPPNLPVSVWFLPRPHTSWQNSPYCPHPPHLVCIKCPVFTIATATKASMGCHYPQGTGPYPRQSGDRRWKERVRLWTDICCLLSCSHTDWSAFNITPQLWKRCCAMLLFHLWLSIHSCIRLRAHSLY